MRSIAEIASEFRLKYGLPPYQPTEEQLLAILQQAAQWEQQNSALITDQEIKDIVSRICSESGKWKYSSLGYSRMRDLLVQLQQQTESKKK